VTDVRWRRDSVGMKVSELSHNDKDLRNAHFDDGKWEDKEDSVGDGGRGRSSQDGVSTVSSTLSAIVFGRGVL